MSHIKAMMLALAISSIAAGPAAAQQKGNHDHDRARRAVERGEIRPLSEILGAVRGKLPGNVVGVEIERRKDRWFYEFRVVGADGRLYEVYVDGASGEIERVKEK